MQGPAFRSALIHFIAIIPGRLPKKTTAPNYRWNMIGLKAKDF
jgi:hypothetical protein